MGNKNNKPIEIKNEIIKPPLFSRKSESDLIAMKKNNRKSTQLSSSLGEISTGKNIKSSCG